MRGTKHGTDRLEQTAVVMVATVMARLIEYSPHHSPQREMSQGTDKPLTGKGTKIYFPIVKSGRTVSKTRKHPGRFYP
jgi:hypothetical protein